MSKHGPSDFALAGIAQYVAVGCYILYFGSYSFDLLMRATLPKLVVYSKLAHISIYIYVIRRNPARSPPTLECSIGTCYGTARLHSVLASTAPFPHSYFHELLALDNCLWLNFKLVGSYTQNVLVFKIAWLSSQLELRGCRAHSRIRDEQ